VQLGRKSDDFCNSLWYPPEFWRQIQPRLMVSLSGTSPRGLGLL